METGRGLEVEFNAQPLIPYRMSVMNVCHECVYEIACALVRTNGFIAHKWGASLTDDC